MSRRAKWAILFAPFLLLSGLCAFLQHFGSRDALAGQSSKKFDAIIIFGARVNAIGEASPILRARTRRAFQLWEKYRCPLVCTGGVGQYPPAESVAQATLLRQWGVPPGDIMVDERSTSTRENAIEAAKLLNGGAHVIAVSEPFHLYRCSKDLENAGLNPVPAPEWEGWNALGTDKKLFYLLREAILVCRDAILR